MKPKIIFLPRQHVQCNGSFAYDDVFNGRDLKQSASQHQFLASSFYMQVSESINTISRLSFNNRVVMYKATLKFRKSFWFSYTDRRMLKKYI